MIKRDERISQKSIWNVSTPSSVAVTLPFYGVESGHFFAESDYYVSRDYHDSFLLLFCMNGSGIVTFDGSELELTPGQAILLDCHHPHSYCTAHELNWEFLWIHFNGAMAKTYYDLVNPEGAHPLDFAHNEEFTGLFTRLSESLSDKDIAGSLLHSSQIEGLLRMSASLRLQAVATSSASIDETIKKAVRYLQENFASPVSLNDLCDDLHISKYHFVRSFKKIMGIPPYSFLINYRITQAKRMLVTTGLSVEEIADKTGFKDCAGFISSFKSHVGETPLHYRREHFEVI